MPTSAPQDPPKQRTALVMPSASAAPWRGQALTRRSALRGLTDTFATQQPRRPDADELVAAIDRHLEAAVQAVTRRDRRLNYYFDWMRGALPEQAAGNLDQAETFLLRLAPQDYVIGQLPSLYAQARAHMRPEDPRLEDMRQIVARYVPDAPGASAQRPIFTTLRDADRESIAAAFDAKASLARRDVSRVRSYRNILLMTACALAIAVGVLTLVTVKHPSILPLCFLPDQSQTAVCPTHTGPKGGAAALAEQVRSTATLHGSVTAARAARRAEVDDRVMRHTASRGDVPLVELMGMLAAAVAAAIALRSMSGTTTPYSLPIALALLKVPTGALTAVLGIVLLRGEFVPGLSALDSSGQIVAWAAIFGAAQQAVTRLVDRQAQGVLDKVGTPGTQKAADGTTRSGATAPPSDAST